MKNKELLNICYKFFNRFITSDTLIEQLSNIDKTNLSKNDIDETNKMIKNIKKIANDIPNIDNQVNSLKKDYASEIDSQERWAAIVDYIDKNSYFIKTFESLTDYELLEFIAQNIKAPFPPNLTQDEFDKLVKVGIERDEREWLWRLAFNYERKKINFDEIADYFIMKKDGYYLIELISAVGECLNIDSIVDKIEDKELIENLKKRKEIISYYMSEEQFNKLVGKIDKN